MLGDGLKRRMAQGSLETKDRGMQAPDECRPGENRFLLGWASSAWMEKEKGN